jgi:hypothetical protein
MSKEQRQQAYATIPLILTIALTIMYGLFAGLYMECRWGLAGCQPLNVTSIYLPESSIINRYPEDKTISTSEIEKSLVAAAEERAAISENQLKTIQRSQELQKQVLDKSTDITRLAGSLKPSEQENNDELAKFKKVSEEIQKEKTANDDVLELLNTRKQALDETIKNLQERLEASHKLTIERQNKRLTWVLFTGLFVLTCAGIFVVAFLLPFWIFDGNPWRRTLLILLALLYISYGLIRLYIDANYTTIFESIISIANGDAKGLPVLYNVFDAVGNTAVLALLITTVFLLWHKKTFFTDEKSKFKEKLDELASRKTYLRVILYTGTILLVISTLRSKVLLDWLQTFILQSNVRNSVDEFSKVLISFQGVFYTLLLAAVYLPARKIIFDRAKTLPISETDEADKQSSLEAAGFVSPTTTPFKDLLPRIAALLAPLLIGPIADLVGKIFD